MTQYLDEVGEPIEASDVKLPTGYSLLSSAKKSVKSKKEPKPLKEVKAKAAELKPISPPKGYLLQAPSATSSGSALTDFTSNPSGELLYRMFKPSEKFGESENLQVPYSKVQNYLDAGGKFDPVAGEEARYRGDKANEGKKPSLFTRAKTAVEAALQPDPIMGGIPVSPMAPGISPNMVKAAGRAIVGAPGYLIDLAKTAKDSQETGNVQELVEMLDPGQIPVGLKKQWDADIATGNKKLAVDNLLGSLAGLGVVAAVTHGATKAVHGSVGVLREKFSPITEPPVRERTNILHRNTAGEVRQAPGQAPSVWLSPVAWKSLMGELYPGEDSAATHGFNLPANEHLSEFATTHQPATPNPMFANVQSLLAEAHKNANEGGVAVGKQRPSIQSNVNVMREELNHTWQRSLSDTGHFKNHLSTEAFNTLHENIPKGMQDHLVEQGYDGTSAP